MRATLLLLSALLAAPEKLVESIEVRVVNVDVVVSDRAGNPVMGLKRDDFEIFENGKPQTITNLYEIQSSGGEAPSPVRTSSPPVLHPTENEQRARRLVLFVDNSSLPFFSRLNVLRALDHYIDREMLADDETTIVTWNPGLKIATPFTTNRAALRAAIKTMSERVSNGSSDMVAQQDQIKDSCLQYIASAKLGNLTFSEAWNLCKVTVDGHTEELARNTRNVLEAMRLTSTTLAGVEGKKVMVIAGAHLPERPGLELTMWAYQTFAPYLRSVNPMQALHETQHNSTTYSIAKFARQANADGVTVYVIDAADSRDFISAEQSTDTDLDQQFASFTNTAQAYQTIANVTGGMLVNSNNFDSAFTTIAKDLGSYYSLGYKPSADAKSTRDRNIVLKTKNPAYRVRSRRTYLPKSSDEQISDRVIANIYHAGLKSDWPIAFTTGAPKKDGDRVRIPIVITIPATLTLLPQDRQLEGGFDVYVAVGNDEHGMSTVSKIPQPVKLPASEENSFRGKPMTYDTSLIVRPGECTISIAVVDQITNTTGFARATIVAR